MLSFCDFYNKLKRQYINLSVYRAASLRQYLMHSPFFCFLFALGKGRAPFPFNITMELTYECNLRCKFCFLYSSDKLTTFRNNSYLNLDEIRKLVASIKGRNTTFILTGGEPTLREDIAEIVESIKKNKFVCGMLTNGVSLEPVISDKLIDLELDYLCVSLDGPKDINDDLRGKNAFDKTYNNINSIIRKRKKYKPKVIVNSVICRENYNRLKEMIDIAAELKIDCLSLSMLSFLETETFKLHSIFLKENFPYEEIMELIYILDSESIEIKNLPLIIKEVKNYAKKKNVNVFLKPGLSDSELKAWFNEKFIFSRRCIYIWNAVRISPYGDVYPCTQFPIKMGNIRSGSIEEIWNSKKYCNFRKTIRGKRILAGCNRCVKL